MNSQSYRSKTSVSVMVIVLVVAVVCAIFLMVDAPEKQFTVNPGLAVRK